MTRPRRTQAVLQARDVYLIPGRDRALPSVQSLPLWAAKIILRNQSFWWSQYLWRFSTAGNWHIYWEDMLLMWINEQKEAACTTWELGMQGKNTGEGQRRKTMRVPQCGFFRKKWRLVDVWVLVSWEMMPCYCCSSIFLYTSFMAEQAVASPGVQLCNIPLLQRPS